MSPKLTKGEVNPKVAKNKLSLELIRDGKEILFGKFLPQLTAEMKTKAWAEIWEHCRSMWFSFAKDSKRGIVYLRDVWWQNLRKTTVVGENYFF